MTEGPGFLEFFILEASEYVEQLDGLLLGSGSSGPDADAVQRVARALRGTATMAKLTPFANLAAAVERIGRAMHDRTLAWDPALGGALVAAVDDLKTSLHAVRAWSPSDDRRANLRSAELSKYAPIRDTAASPPGAPGGGASAAAFLSTEAANIAAGLELLTTRAGDADTATNVLRRIRALRGVAGVKEVGPLAETLEATEDAGRSLESGRAELTAEARRLLESAAAYLRTLASALRSGGDVNAESPARQAFEAAYESWNARGEKRERVVPISDLFYADGSSGVVEASRQPPTTAPERFRLELVSLGEHLRQVVDGARGAKDASSKARVQRELRRAVQALEEAAVSFREQEVAEFVRAHAHAADNIDFLGLSALDDLASVVAEPGSDGQRLRARLHEIAGGRDIATAIGAGFGRETPLTTPPVAAAAPIVVPTPAPAPAAVAARVAPSAPSAPPARRVSSQMATPLGLRTVGPTQAPLGAPVWAVQPGGAASTERPAPPPPAPAAAASPRRRSGATPPLGAHSLDPAAAALIDSGIAALESFTSKPMLAPTPLPEDQGVVVPIESLLYRGRAALDRAVEIRNEMRRGGPSPDPDALEELFDLLELARAD